MQASHIMLARVVVGRLPAHIGQADPALSVYVGMSIDGLTARCVQRMPFGVLDGSDQHIPRLGGRGPLG